MSLTQKITEMFPAVLSQTFTFHNDHFSVHHRFLDHDRGTNPPLDGKDETLRAAKTKDGYCIEYRESALEHV